ncbi:MAG TPA: trypsin-like peptidase domain-containing protein [Vicinamibacteria bacterium]
MARVSFQHLSGAEQGRSTNLPRLPATIGSDPEVDVVIPGLAPRHAVLYQRDGDIVLLDSGSALGTFLAGNEIQEAVLRNGDVVQLGRGGPRLRFQLPDAPRARTEQMMLAFRTAHHQSSRSFRRTLAVVLAIALALLAWSFRQSRRLDAELATLRRAVQQAESERRAFEARVEAERQRGDAEGRRLAQARAREAELLHQLTDPSAGEVPALKADLQATRDRLQAIESERAAGERIIRDFGAGVALIQGAYTFADASGRPLRYREDDAGETIRQTDGGPALDPEGTGPVHVIEYYGTGFLVDGKGLILTNRHIAEPWWNDDEAERLLKGGFHPRLAYLRAFFPQHRQPFELAFERRSDTVDLALLKVNLRGSKIPVLPLDRSHTGSVAGQPVVVVGYPAGLEAILAKAENGVVKQILESHGTNSERVTEALSLRGLIRPSTTQGHIGDITRSDIVFDAPTTQGGSGGPIFNKNGQVIAVEYAVLPKFGGNSFGVPVTYALDLLEPHRAGRKKPAD